jgi:hypothetical protein
MTEGGGMQIAAASCFLASYSLLISINHPHCEIIKTAESTVI